MSFVTIEQEKLVSRLLQEMSFAEHDADILLETALDVFFEGEESQVPNGIGAVTLDPRGGGSSRKASNVLLNWRKLTTTVVPGVIPTIPSVQSGRYEWALVLVGLALFNALEGSSKVDISPYESRTLWLLWKTKGSDDCVLDEVVVATLTKSAKELLDEEVPAPEFAAALESLQRKGCITKLDDPARWMVVERIKVTSPNEQ